VSNHLSSRAEREIHHGKTLAQGDVETTWGWGTPAGKRRARRRAELIIAGAALRPGVRVLELGCGTGNFTRMFSDSGAHITAVDISPDLLAGAIERRLPEDRVQFLEKRFEDCDLYGPFDAVIGSSILHHLEIDPALEKIFALLKPGGHMSFAEPNMLNPQVYLERRFSHWERFSYASPDETAFVRWKLDGLLGQKGFVNRKLIPFDWLHPSTPPAAIRVVEALGRILEHLPVVREFAGSLHITATRPW
jgi:2-polyprenyl-3-methyl-5-hydroxy-6-metoxy-1,4-benzoquinol methylase